MHGPRTLYCSFSSPSAVALSLPLFFFVFFFFFFSSSSSPSSSFSSLGIFRQGSHFRMVFFSLRTACTI